MPGDAPDATLLDYQYPGTSGSGNQESLLESPLFHTTDLSRTTQQVQGTTIAYTGNMWCGIFAYLTRQSGGNPAEKGHILITGNSLNPGYDRVLPALINPQWKGWWCSANTKDSRIQIDFVNHRVQLTHYALKTYNASEGWRHLKSWVLEGSNGDNWVVVHQMKKTGMLNGSNKETILRVTSKGAYQQYRLRMTAPNQYGDEHLFLVNIEMFGILV